MIVVLPVPGPPEMIVIGWLVAARTAFACSSVSTRGLPPCDAGCSSTSRSAQLGGSRIVLIHVDVKPVVQRLDKLVFQVVHLLNIEMVTSNN